MQSTTSHHRHSDVFLLASALLPKRHRVQIKRLDEFVRLANRYVHEGEEDRFAALQMTWQAHQNAPMSQLMADPKDPLQLRVIKNICRQKIMYQYDPVWITLFLETTGRGLHPRAQSANDQMHHLYGTGDVFGLMIAKMLRLPKQAMHAAAMQARAVRFLMLLHQAADHPDQPLLPKAELTRYNLTDPGQETAAQHPQAFADFIHAQLRLYNLWHRQGERVFRYLPKRPAAVLRAIDSHYRREATQLAEEPLTIFRYHPGRASFLLRLGMHLFD